MQTGIQDLFIDFETYYSTKDKYSLRILRTIQYVRDPKFHAHGAVVALGEGEFQWLNGEELQDFLATLDPSKTRVIAHNVYFDGLILTQRYNFRPLSYACTIALARAVLPVGHDYPLDLDSLAKLLGFKGKVNATALKEIDGVKDLTLEQYTQLGVYAMGDGAALRHIYYKLLPHLPEREHDIMSIIERMGVEPVLQLNTDMLKGAFTEISTEREALFKESGYTAQQLGSNPQFAEILKSLNLEPPIKVSPTTGKDTYAFAKGDLEFKRFIAAHPDHIALFKARIASKSNTEMTRARAMFDIATGPMNGTFPMPLNYSGAHTHRLSGRDRLNVQNLKRGSRTRKAIEAPRGYAIGVADSSGIELRVNHWMGDEFETLDLIRSGQDVYANTASKHFGYQVTKIMDERQFGKMLELALGFSMGPDKFKYNAAVGFMGCPETILSDAEAFQAVHGYRMRKQGIVAFWKLCQDMLPMMTRKDCDIEYKCIRFRYQAVELPNGLFLHYPNLRCEDGGQWLYGYKTVKRIYGGLFCENIVQALARIIVMDQMLDIENLHPQIRCVSSTHDENISLLPEANAEELFQGMIEIMSVTPDWAPGLPIDAEGGWALNYSK